MTDPCLFFFRRRLTIFSLLNFVGLMRTHNLRKIGIYHELFAITKGQDKINLQKFLNLYCLFLSKVIRVSDFQMDFLGDKGHFQSKFFSF